jgi:hypothetical protein
LRGVYYYLRLFNDLAHHPDLIDLLQEGLDSSYGSGLVHRIGQFDRTKNRSIQCDQWIPSIFSFHKTSLTTGRLCVLQYGFDKNRVLA